MAMGHRAALSKRSSFAIPLARPFQSPLLLKPEIEMRSDGQKRRAETSAAAF
jgi:hypothetical protein